jgi:hypothetical protein
VGSDDLQALEAPVVGVNPGAGASTTMAQAAQKTTPPDEQPLSQLTPRQLARLDREVKAEHVRRRFKRDPEGAALRARRAVLETDRRCARKKRTEQGARENFDERMARLRLRDIEALFAFRYGKVLTDDDAGIEDAIILAHHVRNRRGDQRRNITATLRRWAPWLTAERANAIVIKAIDRPRRWKATTLGWRLGLTADHRAMLGITTIRAVDCTDEQMAENRKAKARQRTEANRRAKGAVPRADYEANSLSRTKPWEAEGISRRTWERRRKASGINAAGARDASPYAAILRPHGAYALASPAAANTLPPRALGGLVGSREAGQPRRPKKAAKPKASNPGLPPETRGDIVFKPASKKERLAARDHASAPGPAPTEGRSVKTPVPAEPDAQMMAIAAEHGWDANRVDAEWPKFVAFNRAKGNAWADWGHPWRCWVENGIKRDRKARGRPSGTAMADRILSTVFGDVDRSTGSTSMADAIMARAVHMDVHGWQQ